MLFTTICRYLSIFISISETRLSYFNNTEKTPALYMKKIFTLICLTCSLFAHAQFVSHLTYLGYYTKGHIDTILASQNIPTGVFRTEYDVKLYRVLYNTVDWDSLPTTASGLLCVPVNLPCKTPIVSYQHGTTLEKNQAPSYATGNEWFVALIAASIGYIGVEPDYLGLGDGPGFHPYQHAHTEATATIDMIRATKELADTMGAPYNDQLFLLGYSEGGHATMAAHQLIQEQLDSVMHVTASSPMSGAYDMSGVMGDLLTSNQPYPAPYYLPYLLFGYNEVYHLYTNDSDIMVHPYDSILPPLYNGTTSSNAVDAVMPNVPVRIMQPYQVDSFVNYPSTNFFRVKLQDNNTFNWLPSSPMHLYFCYADHYVPYQNSVVAYNHFLQLGATNVDTFDLGNYEHQDCAPYAILNAVTWFQTMAYKPIVSQGIAVTNASSSSASDGAVTAHDTLGEPPYVYIWSNGATTASVTNLAPGTYYVTVTDRNGCTSATDSAVVQNLTSVSNQELTNVRIYPNPSKGMVFVENTDPTDILKQPDVYDMNGRFVKTYAIKQGSGFGIYFDNAAPGIYCVRLRAESGKETRSKITLLE